MLTKTEILTKLKELKPTLYKEYAVRDIGLFGSYSDDSYTEESDIDIIVDLERPIGWKFFTLELFLENIFERKIDLVTKRAISDEEIQNTMDVEDEIIAELEHKERQIEDLIDSISQKDKLIEELKRQLEQK